MKIKKFKLIITLLFVMITLYANGHSQNRAHHIGRLWQTMFPVGSKPEYSPLITSMCYPGGDFNFGTRKNMEKSGLWIGVKDWTDKAPENRFYSYYVSEGGYMNSEAPEFLEPISNKKKVRQRLPLVIVNNETEQRHMDNRKSSSRSSSLKSDEQIITKWATNVGIQVTRTSYAFANPKHDGYIIQEYEFKNTGNVDASSNIELQGQSLTDVYFGLWRLLTPSRDLGHEEMGGEYDEWCHYYGNQPGDTLRGFWYVYDGNNQRKTFDDTGDPSEISGEFLSPQYVAFGVLHADLSYSDESDNINQPATVDFWPSSQVHSYTKGDPEQTLYFDLSSGNQSRGSDTGDYSDSWDPQIQFPQLLLAFGPYDIPFGQDVKIVIYEAVGAINRRLAIEYGRQYELGSLEWNGLTGEEAKNAIIATGRDSLYQVVRRTEWTWENGIEAIPDGPESPNLRIDSGPGKIELEWYYGNHDPVNFAHSTVPEKPDPDTGIDDFSGYRLYRAEDEFTNIYTKIWECGGNTGIPVTNTYVDRDVGIGQNYYYYVVAYDDGTQNVSSINPGKSVESSHFSNRNFQYPAIPYIHARQEIEKVYVVPNPFHYHGFDYFKEPDIKKTYNYDPIIGGRWADQIKFVNLPDKATIRIFTAHGELVKTLEHPNPQFPALSLDETYDELWLQISDSWQTIKSGIYFFHVEGWNLDGKFLGTSSGKFIVIR
jgi:hypothetical protein